MKNAIAVSALRQAMDQISVRNIEQVSRPSQSSVRPRNRQLSVSRELQQKVFELHQQIRKELGDVKYALLGKGMAAVLMGVENDDLNTLCPDMKMVQDMTPTSLMPPRSAGFLR